MAFGMTIRACVRVCVFEMGKNCLDEGFFAFSEMEFCYLSYKFSNLIQFTDLFLTFLRILQEFLSYFVFSVQARKTACLIQFFKNKSQQRS